MAQTTITAATPSDGITTYQKIRIERAPNSGGVPGAWAEVVSIDVDPFNEFTSYTDTGGADTDWYRYRYANTGGSVFSNYSNAIQAGDYLIRQWIKADIPDADLTNSDWDRWRDEVLTDLSVKYIGRPIYPPQSITPSGYSDEWHGLNADIRKVVRVEIYDSAGFRVTATPRWLQFGRNIRIENPLPTQTYKVFGVGILRNLADLDQELFMILYWRVRLKYLARRLADRANFRYFLSADKNTDVPLGQLEAHRNTAAREFEIRLADVRQTYAIPSGSA